jgi:hypothetical protein
LWYLPIPSFPIPSNSSAIKTPDPQSAGPSASMVETEETSENRERDLNVLEPAAKEVTINEILL